MDLLTMRNSRQLADTVQLFNIKKYGAKCDWNGTTGTDDTTAIINAIADAKLAGGGIVFIPALTRFTQPITIDGDYIIIKSFGASCFTNVPRGLVKDGNFTGITIIGSNSGLCDIDVWGADGNGGVGVAINGNRVIISNVSSRKHGSHGFEFLAGNCSKFDNVFALSNAGDGFKVNGTSTPDTNGCVFNGMDLRGNTGWGLNIESGRANTYKGIIAQSNTGGGIRINDQQNILELYAESNGNTQIELTNNSETQGNILYLLEGGVTNNSTKRNLIYDINNVSYRPSSKGMTFEDFSIFKEGIIGEYLFKHDVTRQLDVVATGSSGNHVIRFTNDQGGYIFNAFFTGSVRATDGFKFGNESSAQRIMSGTGSPESVVSADKGSLFLRTDGGAGTTLYVKESGTGNTGWIAK
jgi:hypothetical protein